MKMAGTCLNSMKQERYGEMTSILPLELECHVWNMSHREKLQNLHYELKQKVVLTEDEHWWFNLYCDQSGTWTRREVMEGQVRDYWKLRWGKFWSGWTEKRQALDYVAQDQMYYIKSLGKPLSYKNMRHDKELHPFHSYKPGEVWE